MKPPSRKYCEANLTAWGFIEQGFGACFSEEALGLTVEPQDGWVELWGLREVELDHVVLGLDQQFHCLLFLRRWVTFTAALLLLPSLLGLGFLLLCYI